MNYQQPSHVVRALGMATILSVGCGDSMGEPAQITEWLPLSPTDSYAGKTLKEWAVEWGRWSYAQTDCVPPAYEHDHDGSACTLYQDAGSRGFFLAGGEPPTVRTRCDIPRRKALVVPLITLTADNAGLPESEYLSEMDLERLTAEANSNMTDLQLVVDDREIDDLYAYVVEPTEFSYEVPPAPNWHSCAEQDLEPVSGTVWPAFITGYFIIMPPPPAGKHVLTYGGNIYDDDHLAFPNHVKLEFELD